MSTHSSQPTYTPAPAKFAIKSRNPPPFRQTHPPHLAFPANPGHQANRFHAASAWAAAAYVEGVIFQACASVEQARLRRGPALGPLDGVRRGGLFLQVTEDLVDHRRFGDTGDDPGGPAAGLTRLNVDVEVVVPIYGPTTFLRYRKAGKS